MSQEKLPILVVEDSRLFAQILKTRIEEGGVFRVECAGSFGEAETLISGLQGRFFLALLDLNLPDVPVGQIVPLVLSHNIPCIVFTGEFDDKMREDILAYGIIDYVFKESSSSIDYVISLIRRLHLNRTTKVLVVEDSRSARSNVRQLLELQMLQVFEAEDGLEALACLEQHPDIVLILTDYNMPNMDGFQLIRKIRAKRDKDAIALIGLSSYGNNLLSAKFIKNGADDFLNKPFGHEEFGCRVAHAIDNLRNVRALQNAARTIDSQNRSLESMNQLLREEREMIEDLVVKMRSADHVDPRHLRYLATSVENSSGDLLLSAFTPDDRQLVMLGDFTGHGLPAAVGGPLVASLFQILVDQGATGEQLLVQINHQLQARLPVGIFFAAAIVEVDTARRQARIWNAGIPACLRVNASGPVERIESHLQPLGIASFSGAPVAGQRLDLVPGERIYLFTDGITEAESLQGEQFGIDRLESFLTGNAAHGEPLEGLAERLRVHCQTASHQDDLTLVEIRV